MRPAPYVPGLSSEEVRRRVPALSYRMLYTWTQNGYILPIGGFEAVMFNGGPGHAYRYEPAAVPVLRRMIALTRAGFSPKSASALAHAEGGVLDVGDYSITLTGPR